MPLDSGTRVHPADVVAHPGTMLAQSSSRDFIFSSASAEFPGLAGNDILLTSKTM